MSKKFRKERRWLKPLKKVKNEEEKTKITWSKKPLPNLIFVLVVVALLLTFLRMVGVI